MKLIFRANLVLFLTWLNCFNPALAQNSCLDPSQPVIAASATVVCPGSTLDLTIVSGILNDATDWNWYSNSCGGSPVGTGLSLSVNPTFTTTYYVRGEGGCVTPGACTSQTIVVLPAVTLSLKVFIQGYYLGNGQMTPSIYYSIGSPYLPTDVDLITVELHDVANPCIVVGSYEVVLQTDGTVQVPVDCAVSGGTYYIVIKHRSSIETWSAVPVVFTGSVSYDFSAQQTNAYCDNEIDAMTEGIWSMYSGDFNQDGVIDGCDRAILDNDIAIAAIGYFTTDMNGDGFVDAFDLILFDQNLQLHIAMCSPCSNVVPLVVCPISGPKIFCGDATDGTAVYSVAPVPGATQYNWTVPYGMSIGSGQGSSTVLVTWTAAAAQSGIVGIICVSVPTTCGIAECCDSIKIGVSPVVNLGPDVALCNPGDCVMLSSTPISNVRMYSWSTLPGFVSIPSSASTLVVCPTAPTCYALIVENLAGCIDTDTVCISFYNPPLVSWSGQLAEQCGGDALYTLSGGLPAGGVYSGDGVSGNQFNPDLAGLGVHMLSYTYSDSCGHVTTISKTINVIDCPCKETFCRDFNDYDLHGWTVNPAAPMVDVQITSLNSQNGPADYYLLASDLTGSSLLKAETDFNGRWCCGEFCFDYRTFDDGDPNSVLDIHPVFYLVRGDKTFRFTSSVSVTESNGWQHVCAPITNCNPPPVSSEGVWEALPGTTNNDWDPLTNHIDSIFFQIDWNGGDEIAGFDNVCFNTRDLSATITATNCNTLCATVDGCCGSYSYTWILPPGASISSGAGTSCIQGNFIEGDYSVTVASSTGEVTTTTYYLEFLGALYAGPDVTICQGSCATLSAIPFDAGVTYAWYRLPGYELVSNSVDAFVCPSEDYCYRVVATNSAGCADSDQVCVNVELMELSCSGSNVSCNGGTDGSVCATYNCLSLPYTISWTKNGTLITGAQTLCLNGLSAGTYCINITPANGNIQTCCYTVTEPDQLTIAAIAFDATTCGGGGSFLFLPTGGTRPYTISTDPCPPITFPCSYNTPFGFSSPHIYLAGTYSIFITDTKGCTSSLVKTIGEPNRPIFSVDVEQPLCCGDNGSFIAYFTGNEPYTIFVRDISSGSVLHTYFGISGSSFNCPDGFSAGSYSVEITDVNNCMSSAIINIIDPPCLNANVSVYDAPNCGGNGSFSLYPSGGMAPYTVSISPCPGGFLNCHFVTSNGFSTAQDYPAGTYTITFTDVNGCTVTLVKTIHEPLPAQISVTTVNPLCCGGFGHFNVVITSGTGPYQILLTTNDVVNPTTLHAYLGYTGNNFTSPDEVPAGSYIVEVIDAKGCQSTAIINIVDPPCLELHVSTAGFNGIDCDGHISAYATGGSPFNTNSPNFHVPYDILITQITGNSPGITFSQSGSLNSNPFYNFADQCCSGTYVITVTDSNGCTKSDTVRMNCNFNLSPAAGVPTTMCIRNIEDAQVGQLSPNSNYGNSPSLRASQWTYQGTWATVRTYLKFNINAIPQNLFSSATLSLATCPTCTPFDVHKDLSNPPLGNSTIISGVNGAWAENTITWNNAPAPSAITDAGISLGNQTTIGLNVNVSNIVQDWITSGINNGLMVRLADDPAFPISYYHEVNFASRENADTNIHPRLCVTYNAPSVTICSGSLVPLTAPLIAGVDYKWYTVPGFVLRGTGNVLSVSPGQSQLYAVIAITPSGCRDTNYVQVNVVTDVDDGDDCTSDYCLNGVVFHTRIISCTCPCTAPNTLSPNIVVNGKFSNGNTGFSSDLPYVNACAINSYSVGNTARVKCSNFQNVPDHTTGSGTGNDNFLIVDGRNDGTFTVWNGAVGNIVNGKTYTFSFALHPDVSNSGVIPNTIQVRLGNILLLNIPGNSLTNNWNEFCTSFTASSNIQAARLTISHNITTPGLGYDYGIDDIIFKTCRTRVNVEAVHISNVACYAGNTGSLTVSPTGGVSPYTYLWSNTATTATISNLSAGTYTVTVTDATGEVGTTSLDVLEPPALISTATVTSPIQCYGGVTCIDVNGTGGSPPYLGTGITCTYPEGTHTFTIADANGCFASSTITVNQPSKLENSVSGVSASCGLANGSATSTPSGGIAPYSYEWNTFPTQTGATAVNLLPGFYSITVTDANGCARTDQVTIGNSGTVPAAPGTISGPSGVCRNQVNQVFCVPAVPGATSYTWTLPGGVTGSSTGNCITLGFSSNYGGGFICVTANNSCGSSTAACMNVPVLTVKPAVPSAVVGNSIICGPGTYTFSTPSVANATVYNWSVTGSGVSISNGQGTNTISVSVLTGFGQGTVSVNAGNCIGNSGSRGIYITGVPVNSFPIIGPTVVCPGTNTITYTFGTVIGAGSYLWTSNTPHMTIVSQTGISCVVNFGPGFTTGNLNVEAISSCGSYTRTVIIKSVPAQPGGITGPYVNLCGAQTVNYSIAAVTSATGYNWTSPSGTVILSGQGTTGISVSIPAAFAGGNICVQANNACGSSIARCLTTSALPPPPTGITGPVSVCKSAIQLYSITPISGAVSYNWSITGGAGLVPSGTSAMANFNTALSGIATLKVKGNNACGVGQPAQLTIAVNLGCRSSAENALTDDIFAIYPNPSNGVFTLNFVADKSSACSIKIFDILGNIVYTDILHSVIGENTVDINLSNSGQGIYQMSIQDDAGELKTLRIVIE